MYYLHRDELRLVYKDIYMGCFGYNISGNVAALITQLLDAEA